MCVREREKEREKVCVCARDIERESVCARGREGERERELARPGRRGRSPCRRDSGSAAPPGGVVCSNMKYSVFKLETRIEYSNLKPDY